MASLTLLALSLPLGTTSVATAALHETASASDAPQVAADSSANEALESRIAHILARYPNANGGMYVDEDEHRLHVRVKATPEAARMRAAIAATASQRDTRSPVPVSADAYDVVMEPASDSLADLYEMADHLDSQRAWAVDASERVVAAWVDEYHGQVRLDVTGDVDVLDALAESSLAHAVRTEQVEGPPAYESRRRDSEPYSPGLATWPSWQPDPLGASAYCTAGFHMTKGNSHFVATADHCGDYGDIAWHGTTPLYVFSSSLQDSELDVALMRRYSTSTALGTWVFWGSSNTSTLRPVTAAVSSAPTIGTIVWTSGANSGLVAGRVLGWTRCGGDRVMVRETDIGIVGSGPHTVGGDSGSPVLKSNTATTRTDDLTAVGIHNCGDGVDRAYFTPINSVVSASGARVALSPL